MGLFSEICKRSGNKLASSSYQKLVLLSIKKKKKIWQIETLEAIIVIIPTAYGTISLPISVRDIGNDVHGISPLKALSNNRLLGW